MSKAASPGPQPDAAPTEMLPLPEPGPFTARTLLYLPGLDGTARLLHRQPGLHAAYDVVCQAYPQDGPHTYDSLTNLAVAALEARCTPEQPRAVVLSESFGGAVALMLALKRPELIERLVLVNTYAYFPRRRLIRLVADLAPLLPARPGSPLTRPVRGMFFFAPEIATAERTAWWERTADVPLRTYGHRTRLIVRLDLRPHLHKITLPALVVVAPNDRVVPPSAGRELARLLPNAKLLEMRVGHAAMIHPKLDVARLLREPEWWRLSEPGA
jgi:pimeloyl-ACP methyl ester carboxylesterase